MSRSTVADSPASAIAPASGADLGRQIGVISAVVFMLVAAMVGVGLFGGTPVQDLQGGALAADATVLAPYTSAFSIWSVIYALMIAYAVYQALPGQRARDRHRAAGWWIALSAVVNGLWLVVAQFWTLVSTVIFLVLLVAVLGVAIAKLVAVPPSGLADRLLMDATVGLHLGWASLATVANTTAWLQYDLGIDAGDPDVWGIVVLVVVALLGAAIAWGTRGRIAPGLAMAWGLFWIGFARMTDEPQSTPVALAAWIAAAVVVLAPLAVVALRRRAR